jgi:MYXO-CTERM domain-containing protein
VAGAGADLLLPVLAALALAGAAVTRRRRSSTPG